MWHPARRISPIFGEPTLSWEYLPYHINTREEESLLHYNSGKCPFDLRKLVYLDQILIKRVRRSFGSMIRKRKGYNVMDNDGVNIFHVQQISDFCTQLCCDKFPINYKAYNEPKGKVVMTFTGTPGIFGAGGSMSTHLIRSHSTSIPLGDVTQENNFCDPIFSIVDTKGKKNFSIQGPEEGNCWGVAKTAEFNICQHEQTKVSIIGKLHRDTKVIKSKGSKDGKPKFCKYKWLIECPRDLDPATKVCLIAASFLVESQYYD